MKPKMLWFKLLLLITEISMESLGISIYRNSKLKFSGAVDFISVLFISLYLKMLLKEISLGVVKAGQDDHKWIVLVLGLMVNIHYDGEQKFTVFQVFYYVLLF